MTPEERELRRALGARSGEPSPQFHARLSAAFDEAKPSSVLMQAIAMFAVVAITLGTVGALLLSRNARNIALREGPVSGSRVSTPIASGSRLTSPTSNATTPTPTQVSAPSSKVVWVLVADSQLFRSNNRGSSWEQRSLPPPPVIRPSISFINDHEGWLLASGSPETQCNGAGADVFHTTDGGNAWQRVAFVIQTQPQRMDSGIAYAQCKEYISFVDSTHGFLTAWDDNHRPTIYRTVDGGNNWRGGILPDPPDFKTSAGSFTLRTGVVKRFGSTLYVEAWGIQSRDIPDRRYMFRSTDGGASWAWLMKIPPRSIVMVTESRWLLFDSSGQSMESTNSGQQWHPYATDFTTDTGVGSAQVVFADSQTGYAVGLGQLQRTVDGGSHWERIATPGTSAPSPLPSSTPSQVALLPVTDPRFTCRLPVGTGPLSNPSNTGFVAVPRGAFAPDPGGAMVDVKGQQWSVETPTKPVLKGTEGLSFDAPASRWVPAHPEVFSGDGASYAWTERNPGLLNLLHVTKVADGSDRSFAAGPPQPQDPDLRGHGAFIPVPIGLTNDGVFLTYGWEGTWGVWRLDLASGSLIKVTGLPSPSYGAGAIWLEPTRGPRVGIYSNGDTLARLDLKSGAVEDWYHRDNVVISHLGVDLDGNPWVQAITYDSYVNPQVMEIWRVRSPGQADLVLSRQRVSRVVTDSHGTWFGNETGVYLYAGGRLQRVSSASVGEVVGPCV